MACAGGTRSRQLKSDEEEPAKSKAADYNASVITYDIEQQLFSVFTVEKPELEYRILIDECETIIAANSVDGPFEIKISRPNPSTVSNKANISFNAVLGTPYEFSILKGHRCC